MDEEKQKEESKPTEDTGKGDKPATNTLIDGANLAAKRMEDATEEAKEQNDRKEKLQANELLSSTAGGHVEAVPAKEETDEEYTEKFMKGEVNPMKNDAE